MEAAGRGAPPLWRRFASSMEGVPVHRQEHAICICVRLPLPAPLHPVERQSVRVSILRQRPRPGFASNHAFLLWRWALGAFPLWMDCLSSVEGASPPLPSTCYLNLFAFASSFSLASSRTAPHPFAYLPATLASQACVESCVSDFRVAAGRLHYGGDSPPVWKEYASTAKHVLSAFICCCLFLPSCFQ